MRYEYTDGRSRYVVNHESARRRTVAMAGKRFATVDAPRNVMVAMYVDGVFQRLMYFLVAEGSPDDLDAMVLLLEGAVCLGARAFRNVYVGKLDPFTAFWMTKFTKDNVFFADFSKELNAKDPRYVRKLRSILQIYHT